MHFCFGDLFPFISFVLKKYLNAERMGLAYYWAVILLGCLCSKQIISDISEHDQGKQRKGAVVKVKEKKKNPKKNVPCHAGLINMGDGGFEQCFVGALPILQRVTV